METSLCVILPVHNVEQRITGQLLELLEVLPDLTSRFDILVIDDASTDHTEELVQDLSQTFPQVRLVRHHGERGIAAAAKMGLAYTNADIVFVQQAETRISHTQLRRLWAVRDDGQLVMARPMPNPKPIPRGVIDRLVKWGMELTQMDATSAEMGGLQMIRRQGPGRPAAAESDRFTRTDSPQDASSEPQPSGIKSQQMRRGLTRVRPSGMTERNDRAE